MSTLMSAPPAAAPKTGKDYFHLPAFPAPDKAVILTITAYNFIKDYVNPFGEEGQAPYDAIEWFLGAETHAGIGFVKTNPQRYSLNEKATYYQFFELATGKAPTAGSKPDQALGAGITASITNENKTSKKGKQYVRSKVKDFSAVHPKLAGEITPITKLKPALESLLANAKSENPTDTETAPF